MIRATTVKDIIETVVETALKKFREYREEYKGYYPDHIFLEYSISEKEKTLTNSIKRTLSILFLPIEAYADSKNPFSEGLSVMEFSDDYGPVLSIGLLISKSGRLTNSPSPYLSFDTVFWKNSSRFRDRTSPELSWRESYFSWPGTLTKCHYLEEWFQSSFKDFPIPNISPGTKIAYRDGILLMDDVRYGHLPKTVFPLSPTRFLRWVNPIRTLEVPLELSGPKQTPIQALSDRTESKTFFRTVFGADFPTEVRWDNPKDCQRVVRKFVTMGEKEEILLE